MNYVINDNQKTNTSIFNLGTGNGVTVFEAIQSFGKVSEQKLNYKVGERRAGVESTVFPFWVSDFVIDAESKRSGRGEFRGEV